MNGAAVTQTHWYIAIAIDYLARCSLHWGGHRAEQTPQHNITQEIMKTTTLLFKNNNGTWSLASFKGDTIPTLTFKTATDAKVYAKKQKWAVLRDKNCDA